MDTVQTGMTKRQVKRLLGRPHQSMNTKEFLKQYKTVVSFGPISKQEYWLYVNVPPGSETQIVFQRGRVTEAKTVPTQR